MSGVLPVYAVNTLVYFEGSAWVAGGIFHRVMTHNLTRNMDVDFFTSSEKLAKDVKAFATDERKRIAALAKKYTANNGMPSGSSELRAIWDDLVSVKDRYNPNLGVIPRTPDQVDWSILQPAPAMTAPSLSKSELQQHVGSTDHDFLLSRNQARVSWSPKFQVVSGFLFDNCEDTLASFDLRTAMIGTDGKTLWYNPLGLADIRAGHFCRNPDGEIRKYPNPMRLLKHLNHSYVEGSAFSKKQVILGPRVVSKLLGTHRKDFSRNLMANTVSNGDYD